MTIHSVFSQVGFSTALPPAVGARVSTSIRAGDHSTLACVLNWSSNYGTFEVLLEHADLSAAGTGPGAFTQHPSDVQVISATSGVTALQIDRGRTKEFVRVRVQNFQGGATVAVVGANWQRFAPRRSFNIDQTAQLVEGVTRIPSTLSGVFGLSDGGSSDPVVTLASGAIAVGESAGVVQIPVILSEIRDEATSVQWQFTSGTATLDTDFEELDSSPLVIPAGSTLGLIEVTILSDEDEESNETFGVELIGTSLGTQLGLLTECVVTIVDDDEDLATPEVYMPLTAMTESEGVGILRVPIFQTELRGEDTIVTVSTTVGTATPGKDFGPPPTQVTIPTGQIRGWYELGIEDDPAFEADETFTVTITGTSSGTALGSPLSTVVTITNNDPADVEDPAVSFIQGNTSFNENGGTLSIPVVLSEARDTETLVDWEFVAGTATEDVDYRRTTPNPVSIPAGQTTGSLQVDILDDALVEPNETFGVRLTSTSAGTQLGEFLTRTVTILENDVVANPLVAFASASSSVAEGNSVDITIELSEASVSDINIAYGRSGTASYPGDYTYSPPSQLTIPAGETEIDITVDAVADGVVEGSESLIFTIQGASGADLGGQTTHTLTITSADSSSGTYGDSPIRFDALQNNTSTTVYGVTGIDPVPAGSLPALAVNGVEADVWPHGYDADGNVDSVEYACNVTHASLTGDNTLDVGALLSSTITTPTATVQFNDLDISGLRYEIELAGDGLTEIDPFENEKATKEGNWMAERHHFGLASSAGGTSVGVHTFIRHVACKDVKVIESVLVNDVFNPDDPGGLYVENSHTAGDVYCKFWRYKSASIPAGWAIAPIETRVEQSGLELIKDSGSAWHVIPARVPVARRAVMYRTAAVTLAEAKEIGQDRGVAFCYSGDLSAHSRPWAHGLGVPFPSVRDTYTDEGSVGRAAVRKRMQRLLTSFESQLGSSAQGTQFVSALKGWHRLVWPDTTHEPGEAGVRSLTGFYQIREECQILRHLNSAQMSRHAIGLTDPTGDPVTAARLYAANGGKAPWASLPDEADLGSWIPHFHLGVSTAQGPGGVNPGLLTDGNDAPHPTLQPINKPWTGPGFSAVVLEDEDAFPMYRSYGRGAPYTWTHYYRRWSVCEGGADTMGGLFWRWLCEREMEHMERCLSTKEVDPRGRQGTYKLVEFQVWHGIDDIVNHPDGKLFHGGQGGGESTNPALIHRGWGEGVGAAMGACRLMPPGARKNEVVDWDYELNRLADVRTSPLGVGVRSPFTGDLFATANLECQWGITDLNNETGALPLWYVNSQSFFQVHVCDAAVRSEVRARPRGTFVSGQERPMQRYGIDFWAHAFRSARRKGSYLPWAYQVAGHVQQLGLDWAESAPDGKLGGVGTGAPYFEWNLRHSTSAERTQLGCSSFSSSVKINNLSRACVALGAMFSWLYRNPDRTDIPILDWAKDAVEQLAGEDNGAFTYSEAVDYLWSRFQLYPPFYDWEFELPNLMVVAGWLENATALLTQFPHWSVATGGADATRPSAPGSFTATAGDGQFTISGSAVSGCHYMYRYRAQIGGVWKTVGAFSSNSLVVQGADNGTVYECQMRAVDQTTFLPSDWTSTATATPFAPSGGNPYQLADLTNTGPTVVLRAPNASEEATWRGTASNYTIDTSQTVTGIIFNRPVRVQGDASVRVQFVDCQFNGFGFASGSSTSPVYVDDAHAARMDLYRCRIENGTTAIKYHGGDIVDCQITKTGEDGIHCGYLTHAVNIEHNYVFDYGYTANRHNTSNPHADVIQIRNAAYPINIKGNHFAVTSTDDPAHVGGGTRVNTNANALIESATGPIVGPVEISWNTFGSANAGLQLVNDHLTPGGSGHPDYGPVQGLTVVGNIISEHCNNTLVDSDANVVLAQGNFSTDGTNIDNLF